MIALGIDTRVAFTVLVAAVAVLRLVEVVVAARNTRRLLAAGGVEAGRGHLPAMTALHAAFLVAAPAEVWALGRPFVPWLASAALALLLLAFSLRAWTLATLGSRWTTRVIAVPGERPVARGPYRYVRHPNYVVVAAELLALPLVHAAWLTALVFGAFNAWLLAVRIRTEEALLRDVSGYDAAMARTPRFVPRAGSVAGDDRR